MQWPDLYLLLADSLPAGISPDAIWRLAEEKMQGSTVEVWLEHALRQSGLIDWQAYLENNPDVKDCKTDPVSHFARHGIFEGRKLYPLQRFTVKAQDECPKISIVVANYNNGDFIGKCIDSLTTQTFDDIEIIIVDDCSTDNSLEVIKELMTSDPRIRIIPLKSNRGTLIARKIGVASSRGRYIMFVDADDFLVNNACEKAYNVIIKGYDIVVFNLRFINLGNELRGEFHNQINFANGLMPGVYIKNEIMRLTFSDAQLSWLLIGRIFSGELVRSICAGMEFVEASMAEDLYTFLMIVMHARTLCKINDELYCYSRGHGITSVGATISKSLDPSFRNAMLPHIKKYCHVNNLLTEYEYIRDFLFDYSLYVIKSLNPEAVTHFFDTLLAQFGLFYTVARLYKYFFRQIDDINAIFRNYVPAKKKDTNTSPQLKIGICNFGSPKPDTNKYVMAMAEYLSAHGYEICIFNEQVSDFFKDDLRFDTYYVSRYYELPRDRIDHLTDLHHLCNQTRIAVMIFAGSSDPGLLWDLMLMKFMGIEPIVFYPGDASLEILARGNDYHHCSLLSTFRCASKVLCLDRHSCLYFLDMGVDSSCIALDLPLTAAEVIIFMDISAFGSLSWALHRLEQVLAGVAQTPTALVLRNGDYSAQMKVGDCLAARSNVQFYPALGMAETLILFKKSRVVIFLASAPATMASYLREQGVSFCQNAEIEEVRSLLASAPCNKAEPAASSLHDIIFDNYQNGKQPDLGNSSQSAEPARLADGSEHFQVTDYLALIASMAICADEAMSR